MSGLGFGVLRSEVHLGDDREAVIGDVGPIQLPAISGGGRDRLSEHQRAGEGLDAIRSEERVASVIAESFGLDLAAPRAFSVAVLPGVLERHADLHERLDFHALGTPSRHIGRVAMTGLLGISRSMVAILSGLGLSGRYAATKMSAPGGPIVTIIVTPRITTRVPTTASGWFANQVAALTASA